MLLRVDDIFGNCSDVLRALRTEPTVDRALGGTKDGFAGVAGSILEGVLDEMTATLCLFVRVGSMLRVGRGSTGCVGTGVALGDRDFG